MDSAKNDMRQFSGVAVSPGIAVGHIRLVDRRRLSIEEYSITQADAAAETIRLKNAIARTRDELETLKEQLQETAGDDHLFFIDTHLMILADERLLGESSAIIETGLVNAEGALQRSLHRYRDLFAGIEDAYLRERISDVETV